MRRKKYRILAVLLAFTLAALIYSIVHDRNREIDDSANVQLVSRVKLQSDCAAMVAADATKLQVTEYSISDQDLSEVELPESIETLLIDKGYLGDGSMAAIAKLPNLGHLRLRLSPIGDAGMKSLSESQSIWSINLPHAVCTSEGVRALSAMPRLRSLRLGSELLSGDASRAIEQLDGLRQLHLIGVPITDDGLRRIASMPRLESLYLDDSAVTEAGWQWLFENHSNLHVHIDQQHHDRDPHRHNHR